MSAKSKKQAPFWEQKWFRNVALFTIAVLATGGLALAFIELSDNSAVIEFVNESNCPQVVWTLQGADGTNYTVSLRPGETEEIEVSPDVEYDYLMDTNSDPDINNMACFDRDEGTVNVPAGGKQTFRLKSQTRPTIAFINDTDCEEAYLELTSLRAEDQNASAAPNETSNVEIAPDIEYNYEIDACGVTKEGKITLSLDRSQTFRVSEVVAESEDSAES